MSEYDLQSLALPKLAGTALRAFAAALENPLTRPLLMPRLLKQGGFDRFRNLVLTEPPTYAPLVCASVPAVAPLSPSEVETSLGERRPDAVFRSARDYAEAYRAGQSTPEAIALQVLDAIRRSELAAPPLRAFIASNREDVLIQAREATARIAAGKALSLLDGVPVAIKDEVDQVPYPTTVGTVFLGGRPATADATAVARLRAAGALLIGKANMHEIGINPSGANAHYGPARNPYNPSCDCGGSSSGPAVAVASGLCPIALGADGGGSIRIPASLCGVIGLKPTYGRISEHGAAPLCWSVAHLGPIGATVDDVALAYGIMAGPDPEDPNSLCQPRVTLEGRHAADLHGMILGLYRPWFEHAAPGIVAANMQMIERFQQAGAQVRDVVIRELDAMRLAHAVIILSEMAASMAPHREQHRLLGASVRASLALAGEFTSADYIKAQQMRSRALSIFEGVFREIHALITPATAITAPSIPATGAADGWSDLSAATELMRYVFPANLAGLPAVSFPAGYDDDGLPIGMQAMSRHWDEVTLLRIASIAELQIQRLRPAVFFPVL